MQIIFLFDLLLNLPIDIQTNDKRIASPGRRGGVTIDKIQGFVQVPDRLAGAIDFLLHGILKITGETLDFLDLLVQVVLEGPSAVQATAAATPGVQRSVSQMSQSRSATPTRTSTLKKRASLTKRGSMRRSGSKKSMRAGSVRSLDWERYGADGVDDINSAFTVPIPTDGNPTEALANRFQCTFFHFYFSVFLIKSTLTSDSMAQDPERSNYLLQRNPEILRNAL